MSYNEYSLKAKYKLMLLVEKFTPKCIKKDNRVQELYGFFKFFILKISKSYTDF